ncbi:outer membrane protein assembly factor BamB family protein [Halobacterium jilantaiense]
MGGVREYFEDETTVEGACDGSPGAWPTAGGDSGRTGHTDTAPPATDADAVDLLAGIHEDGRQQVAAALPVVADGTAYVPVTSGLIAVNLEPLRDGAHWTYDLDEQIEAVPLSTCGVVLVPGLNRLAAVDQGTGERYWRVSSGSREATSVASRDETIFLAGPSLRAIDVRTEDRLWSVDGGDHSTTGASTAQRTSMGGVASTATISMVNSGGISHLGRLSGRRPCGMGRSGLRTIGEPGVRSKSSGNAGYETGMVSFTHRSASS